jgi:hypothetical protein
MAAVVGWSLKRRKKRVHREGDARKNYRRRG